MHSMWIAFSQVNSPSRAHGRDQNPQHFLACAQAGSSFTQVIHRIAHRRSVASPLPTDGPAADGRAGKVLRSSIGRSRRGRITRRPVAAAGGRCARGRLPGSRRPVAAAGGEGRRRLPGYQGAGPRAGATDVAARHRTRLDRLRVPLMSSLPRGRLLTLASDRVHSVTCG